MINFGQFYYNQNDYGDIKYDKPTTKKVETVKSSGCGVCCALMALNNLYNKKVMTVAEMANFSLKNNARDNTGTNMNTLLKALEKKYAIKYAFTTDVNKVVKALKNGKIVILNQSDSKYEVFSSSGHYVYAYKCNGDDIYVYDSAYTYDRYKKSPKKDRIKAEITRKGCIVSSGWVAKACKGYYIVEYTGKYNSPYTKMTCNAVINKLTNVFGTNSAEKVVQTLNKGQKIELIKGMPTWSIIRCGINKDTYRVGLVKSKDIEV